VPAPTPPALPRQPVPERLASASQPPVHTAVPPNHTTPAAARVDSRTSRIQEALARRGFYHGPVDGVSSGRTASAIRAFQTSLGDSPTGGLTQLEVVKLLNPW
jgi:peptidoglycan hydrolase-like protein with peptidoglycan-binding domain